MIGFGFFPFGFLFPLVFFVLIARIASRYFRRDHREPYLDDADVWSRRDAGQRSIDLPSRGPNPEAQIFKLAYRLKGRLTISDIVVETGLRVSEAEQLVESMVDNNHVRMEVDERGMVTYEFPEIMRRFESD